MTDVFSFLWDDGARARWAGQLSADLNLNVVPGPVAEAEHVPLSPLGSFAAGTMEVKKLTCVLPFTDHQIEEAREFAEGIAANQARRAAMTPEQRAAEDAEWVAQREADRLARTCKECGCDPDEHGGY